MRYGFWKTAPRTRLLFKAALQRMKHLICLLIDTELYRDNASLILMQGSSAGVARKKTIWLRPSVCLAALKDQLIYLCTCFFTT